MRIFNWLLIGMFFLGACATLPAPSGEPTPLPPSITSTPRLEPTQSAPKTSADYVIFSINVQDFSHPAESAAILEKIIDLHEQVNLPVDIYLTDVMAQIYAEQYPALLERLKTSPVVAVSYHYRAPRPYANQYDWLGLGKMSPEELTETLRRYETQAVDPVTGQTTGAPGGYQLVASLLGYPPYAASSLAGDPEIDTALLQVFKELGAQMTVVHGRAINLGEIKKGLPIRPEHYDDMLFQQVGQAAGPAFETALSLAHTTEGGHAPYFVGVKMHDNDFFATQSAWLTVYLDGGKRPPWNPTLSAPLLSETEQAAMWKLYAETVAYVAGQPDRLQTVNLPLVLALLAQQEK